MSLNYKDTLEEFESMLENLISEEYILNGLASYGLLPQKMFSIEDIKFLANKNIETNLTDKNIFIKEYEDIQTSYSNNSVVSKDSLFKNPVKNMKKGLIKNTSILVAA